MQWICSIALFMVLSGVMLELIADTKYYKFARWVAGVILLLQFLKPFTEAEHLWDRFVSGFASFEYALGTDRVLEELYAVSGQRSQSVLNGYKESVALQIDKILRNNGLKLEHLEISVKEDGTIEEMKVQAVYLDTEERTKIWIPTVAPINASEIKQIVSPLELYIRETLAEFYRMEKNKIEVVIQEAE